MTLLALALLETVMLSAAPGDKRSIAVMLIPMNGPAEGSTVRLETYLSDSLTQFPSLVVKKSDEPPQSA